MMTDQIMSSELETPTPKLGNWRKIAVAVGLSLIAIALLTDLVGLGGGEGFGRGQWLISILGVGLVVVGILGPHIPAIYRASAFMMFNTVILLLALELGLRGINVVGEWLQSWQAEPAADVDEDESILRSDARWEYYSFIANLPYYRDQTWTEQFMDDWNKWELGGSSVQFYPYTMWRSAPFASETINFGEDRLRVTPGAACTADAYTVYMFGGSTLVGFGSPDHGTVAAYLQTKLADARDEAVCVKNFGQLGYVALQGLIELMRELERGNVPDTVIFYDGVNEVIAAWQTSEAYTPNLGSMVRVVSASDNERQSVAGQLFANTMIYQLLSRSQSQEETFTPYSEMGIDREALAMQVVDGYLGTYSLVESLSQTYGFDIYLFWQPVMYGADKPLTPEEEVMWTQSPDHLIELFQAVYGEASGAIAGSRHENLYDISDSFSDSEEQIYIDYMHTGPPGNEIIAQRMFEILQAS